MKIIQRFLTPNKYSRPRIALLNVRKIANHYVGNPGSSALANRNYFESLKNTGAAYASSHYIIGLEGEIIQCVPENEVAYCTNEANSYSISIECCHPDATGKFTDATLKSLIWLNADLCERHSLNPLTDIIRHYDITGKDCPRWYVRNPAEWVKLKQDVYCYINNGGGEVTQEQFEQMFDVMMKKAMGDTAKEWFEKATEAAKKAGIFKGDGKGNYNWGLPVTREALASVLYEAGITEKVLLEREAARISAEEFGKAAND